MKIPWILLGISLASLLWRLPSLFDPPWVNDEGTYFAVAQATAHGFRLYADVWENKPPGIYLLYGAVYHAFGPSLIAVRVIAMLIALAIVLLTYHLAMAAAGRSGASAAALLVGLLLGVPFLEGTTMNAELAVAALAALGVYLALERHSPALAGAVMTAAIAFKAVALFDGAAIFIWLVLHQRREAVRYVVGGSVAVGVALAIVFRYGVVSPLVRDALLYDIGYVGHGNGGSIPWILCVKLATLAAATVALRRAPFPPLWLAYAAMGALFSGRIFGHYLLQAAVPLALALAPCLRGSGSRPIFALVTAFLTAAGVSAAVGFAMQKSGHDSILASRLQYYANFVRFAAGAESYATYRDGLDDHVGRNEGIASALRKLPPGRLLVWGNTPWVYVLSGRLPVTPYTSALRQPAVPGETSALRGAIRDRRPVAVVVVGQPAPPLGSAARELGRWYVAVRRVGDAVVYERAPAPASAAGIASVTASATIGTR